MNNLIKFLSKYHLSFFFIFLQLIAILLIVQNNKYHRAGFINSANSLTGGLYASFKSIEIYFDLKEQNAKLAYENAVLLNKINTKYSKKYIPIIKDSLVILNDSTEGLKIFDTIVKKDTFKPFEYYPALVVSNSTNKTYNYIYVNKGLNDSIHNNMGVVETDGVVGVVVNSTNKYSVIMPLINAKSNLSVKIKNQDYFGTLNWEFGYKQTAIINEIPNHVVLKKGDTIVTSGYSHIFPRDLLIGYVEESRKTEGNSFLNIRIKFAVNFSKLNYVYILKNNNLKFIKEIEVE